MKSRRNLFSLKHLALLLALTGLAATNLSGCMGIPLPPIPVTISLVQNVSLPADSVNNGSAQVVVGAFCDLFNEADLDMLIRQAAGDLVADLVSIPGAELDSVTITATQGDFSTFTAADLVLSVLPAGSDPLPLGMAESATGLGASFALTQDMPVDLLNDLEDGQCGVPTLTLTGTAPAEDIVFSATATVLVYTQVNVF